MNGFDLLAPFYDWLSAIIYGKSIKKASFVYLEEIDSGHEILVLGGGTGAFLEQLNKNAHVTFVEKSRAMIRKAKLRNYTCSVEFIEGSYTDIPNKKYDAVLLFFFLDMFTTDKNKEIIKALEINFRPNTIILFADFVHQKSLWKRSLIKLMYLFFKVICSIQATSLPDYDRILASFNLKIKKKFFHGMIESRYYLKS